MNSTVGSTLPLEYVDFVFMWDHTEKDSTSPSAYNKRRIFERNIKEEGLLLERVEVDDGCYSFIKIYAPVEVLERYCEILEIKMPIKQITRELEPRKAMNGIQITMNSCLRRFNSFFGVDQELFPKEDQILTAVYSRDKEYLFDLEDDNFFTATVRSRIIDFIIKRKRFTEDLDDEYAFGIKRLLADNVYYAAYPLHDGSLTEPGSQRYLLFTEWASLRKCFKYQPLDNIKEYFGVKVALYFAWLGFYTRMLIPASIVGVICFFAGLFTLNQDQIVADVCDTKSNFTMCPQCDKYCGFWDLHDTCSSARLTHLFDNDAIVFFAICMSFWTAIFLEQWKRYSAELSHRWNLTGFDIEDEHPRPEYLARTKKTAQKRYNALTNSYEYYAPFWSVKLPYRLFSISMVLMMITLAVAGGVAVIIYRLSFMVTLNHITEGIPDRIPWGAGVIQATAGLLNLLFILAFNWMYSEVAHYLTEMEIHRTESDFENSLSLKVYMLEFVNYYSATFYIAFFQGKFIGTPTNYKRLFNHRLEDCGPGGCMTDLCIHLAVVMVGKQVIGAIGEMFWPRIKRRCYCCKVKKLGRQKRKPFEDGFILIQNGQWREDAKLLEWTFHSLFTEYLEMVIQYGFVTIFAAAFPLAPLFALVNNIVEMRLDAKKFLTLYKRPVYQVAKNIGVWYSIMNSVARLAIVSSACIIAFTSSFIPKLVYKYYAHDPSDYRYGTLIGYLNHSLSSFNKSHFDVAIKTGLESREVCRFPAYRHSYNEEDQLRYKETDYFWKVLLARLLFVVIYENVVALGVLIFRWMFPDVPKKVKRQIRMEKYLTNEIIIRQEMMLATGFECRGETTAWKPVGEENRLQLTRIYSEENVEQEGSEENVEQEGSEENVEQEGSKENLEKEDSKESAEDDSEELDFTWKYLN